MGSKYRAQILLEPEQHEALSNIAQREGRSISDVAREIIRMGLDAVARDNDAVWRKRMKALERLNTIREEIRLQQGTYPGDLVDEVRRFRQSQLESIWKAD